MVICDFSLSERTSINGDRLGEDVSKMLEKLKTRPTSKVISE
jgi:hypothetical protein